VRPVRRGSLQVRSGFMKGLGKYWGWAVFAVLLVGWVTSDLGPGALLALSALSAVYFFFRAPAWCGALGRDGACRNNSKGVLMGCHLNQHKWQKLKMVVVRERWRQLARELFPNPTTALATVGGVVAIMSGLVATLQPVFGAGW
jgi:hypothetical protein